MLKWYANSLFLCLIKVNSSISEKELLSQFKKVEELPNDSKSYIKNVIDALLLQTELKIKYAH
ncbi:MAG: hypothetical protein V4511_02455 [Bacteroidota bacterium]